jgi:hypothetical protein
VGILNYPLGSSQWKQIFEKMCENNEENIPPEVFEAARKATLNLLPQKSRQQYELVFEKEQGRNECNGKCVPSLFC